MCDKYNISADDNYLAASSTTECTGLIPANSTTEDALEVYRELFPFGAPTMEKDK